MNELDLMIAKTQRQLAFYLVTILVLLVIGVGLMLFVPSFKPEQAILGLIIQAVTGVLGLAGSAIAFFFARHRPATRADGDENGSTVSTTDIHSTSSTTPLASNQPEKQT